MNSLLRKQTNNTINQRSYSVEQFQQQYHIPKLTLNDSQVQTDLGEIVSFHTKLTQKVGQRQVWKCQNSEVIAGLLLKRLLKCQAKTKTVLWGLQKPSTPTYSSIAQMSSGANSSCAHQKEIKIQAAHGNVKKQVYYVNGLVRS